MVDSYVGFWFHCSPNPNTLLHRDLGFWYILAGFTVGLIGVGFFKIGKKRKITKQPENKR